MEDTRCELCGEGEDTLHHRLWLCSAPCAVQARCTAGTEAVIREASAAGPTSTLFQHALLPHPCDIAPGPAASGVQWWARDGPGISDVGPQFGGDVFADGHASRTGIDGMNRASWALVQLDPDGSERGWVRSVVPACLPQTAQAAEFSAGAYAAQACAQPSTLHDDCLNVVKSFNRPREAWGDERAMYAGCMRQALISDPAGNLASVAKVKAHQDVEHLDLAVRESFLAWGNHRADHHAELAEGLHGSASKEVAARLAAELEKVRVVLAVMGMVLTLWPFPTERRVRTAAAAKQARAPRVPVEKAHRWFQGPRCWTCWICRTRTRAASLPAPRRSQACPGLSDHLARNAEFGLGHVLVEFGTSDGAFTICSSCGRYGSRYARGLAKNCTGQAQTRSSAIAWRRVFQKGQHPYTAVPFRSHADGVLSVSASAEFRQTRGQVVAGLRKHRLRGKTKPWAAALFGVFARPDVQANREAAETMPEEIQEDEALVFGAIDADGNELPVVSPLPPPTASGAATPHDSLQARLLYEWRERKRRRVG